MRIYVGVYDIDEVESLLSVGENQIQVGRNYCRVYEEDDITSVTVMQNMQSIIVGTTSHSTYRGRTSRDPIVRDRTYIYSCL
jgi:hypothetical protein